MINQPVNSTTVTVLTYTAKCLLLCTMLCSFLATRVKYKHTSAEMTSLLTTKASLHCEYKKPTTILFIYNFSKCWPILKIPLDLNLAEKLQ